MKITLLFDVWPKIIIIDETYSVATNRPSCQKGEASTPLREAAEYLGRSEWSIRELI